MNVWLVKCYTPYLEQNRNTLFGEELPNETRIQDKRTTRLIRMRILHQNGVSADCSTWISLLFLLISSVTVSKSDSVENTTIASLVSRTTASTPKNSLSTTSTTSTTSTANRTTSTARTTLSITINTRKISDQTYISTQTVISTTDPTNVSNKLMFVLFVIPAVALLLVVILLAICCVRRRKRQNKQNKQTPNLAVHSRVFHNTAGRVYSNGTNTLKNQQI